MLRFLKKNFPPYRVKSCFKYHKYYFTLRCMKTTPRIFQFFCYDNFVELLAAITCAKNFYFLAGVVSKIFAIESALQPNNQFLRNAPEKSYLLRHLTITIAYKNLILEIGYTHYANSVFLQRSIFCRFFPQVNSLKTYCAYFFSGKLKSPRASKHWISLARRASCQKFKYDPCLST